MTATAAHDLCLAGYEQTLFPQREQDWRDLGGILSGDVSDKTAEDVHANGIAVVAVLWFGHQDGDDIAQPNDAIEQVRHLANAGW